MKKLLTTLTLSSALLLTACGGEDTADTTDDAATEDTTEEVATDGLQDGSYRIEELNFGGTGWKEALEINVDGGEITDANFESVDEDGNNKIEDDEYQESMAGAVEIGPQDFIPELEESVVEAQDPADIEVVTGATGTSEKVQDFAQQLVEAAEEGNTDTIEVDNSEE